MKNEAIVIYNDACPICSREIEMYRDRANRAGAPLRFEPLDSASAHDAGLRPCDTARRLHVIADGKVLRGVDAFSVMWKMTPGFQWLGRLVRLPMIRPIAGGLYEWVLAPLLFKLHERRERKRV